MASRKKINQTNASLRSIKSFLRSNEKVDGGKAVQNKRMEADLDGEVENEIKKLLTIFIYAYIVILLFALLPKISSIVYKKVRPK